MSDTRRLEVDLEQLLLIADILCGAAYADEEFEGSEGLAIQQLLLDTLGVEQLPEALVSRLGSFDSAAFDLAATAAALRFESDDQRRDLLSMVAIVTDADDLYDLREDDYIRQVGAAVGLRPEDLEDMTIEIVEVELAD